MGEPSGRAIAPLPPHRVPRGGRAVLRVALSVRLRRAWRRFPEESSGATVLEYGLICLLVFVAIASGIRVYANATNGMYERISNAVTDATK